MSWNRFASSARTLLSSSWTSFAVVPKSGVTLSSQQSTYKSIINRISLPPFSSCQIRFHSHHSHFKMADVSSYSTNVPGDREILPKNVKPTHYDLTLEPNFETFKFEGTVKIDLDVKESTSTIALNTLDIEIHSAKIADVKAAKITHDTDKERTVFEFDNNLVAGSKATLEISFTGELNDKMAGFYRSSYEEDGKTKYLATTQMEPTDCRRAFPCFDEPALKATFTVTLIADKELTCLSNMDVKEESLLQDNKKSVTFNPTPLMSTYLVAFIVGDLKYYEVNSYTVPIRVYTTPGLESQGKFSAELAAKTLAFFDKTFDIPFPLPKMDMVAIHDFSAGAMENWGLITYRVVDLLFDEENSNLDTKQRVAEVVQHELAHQWFGNLVTMDWWEGLWLNEGFATWMSWFSCNEFYPEWKVWEQYVIGSLHSALSLDALRSSHPIEVPVKKADEINQIFDAISYSKGSSLLKMISRWLGEDVFIKGVSRYLKKHKYGNTQTGDLWAALSEASGKDVVGVMDIWTKRVGYPVISVTENGNEITFKQNRYLTTGDAKPEEDETIYPVFLGLRTKAGTDESIVLNTREKTLTLEDSSFFKINADQAGIYRTLYSPERWVKLGEAGTKGLLSVEDRAGLVDDAAALATSGYASTTSFLSLVKSWKSESDYVVWSKMLSDLGSIKGAWMFEPEETRSALSAFIRDLVSEKAKSVGWKFSDKDSFMDQLLKSLLFNSAASAKDPEIVQACSDMFKKYISGDKKAIDPNLKDTVFYTVAANGGEKEYEELLSIYKKPVSADEKIFALRSLGRFKDDKLITKTLAMLLDGSVRSQDIYIPLQGLRTHSTGVNHIWNWLQDKWQPITDLLPPSLSMLSSVVFISVSGFTSQAKKSEIEKFFADKDTKGYDKGLAQALETVESKAAWIKKDGENVNKWFSENGYKK